MAVIGCYTMDLYCDTGGDPYGATCPQTVLGLTPVKQYTGHNERACLVEARHAGWTFKNRRYAYCPACSKGR